MDPQEQPGGGEHPREARTDGVSLHTNPRKEEKGDSPLSPSLQPRTAGKTEKPGRQQELTRTVA